MAKFKTEIALLLTSIVLFFISAFCFSYANKGAFVFQSRELALPFVGFCGALNAAKQPSKPQK
jgi:hypothetical protein